MLSWALTFLIVALLAGALGFGGVAGEAAWVAHVLFCLSCRWSPDAACLRCYTSWSNDDASRRKAVGDLPTESSPIHQGDFQ